MVVKEFDCIILGTGLAGINTALNINSNLKVAMFAKDKVFSGSSVLAQGGIAAELTSDEELLNSHIEDTLKAGSYLNNADHVNLMVKSAKESIDRLLKFGVKFDKDSNDNLVLANEGGHSSRRVLHSGGDATGNLIMLDLHKELKKRKNIQIFEELMAVKLLKEKEEAIGVMFLDSQNNSFYAYAKKIVLATGGIGGIYKNSTNDKISTGDGIALASRAGASISNMEFVQFHPTALYEEDKIGQKFLITEAIRGEGAFLKNIEGSKFMSKYTPLLELAPRDIVSQSIYKEMFDTWSDHVYLDITFKDEEYLKERFPNIYNKCKKNNINISKDYIPVAPVQHFLCGGIDTDIFGKTNLKNLYAVGEVANTNVHGANRLASNSLLECIVFSYNVACDINGNIIEKEIKRPKIQNDKPSNKPFNFKSIRNEVREVMDKYASIVRTKEGLKIAHKILNHHYNNLTKIEVLSRDYYETLNMVSVGLLIVKQAYYRQDSIGCHYRVS